MRFSSYGFTTQQLEAFVRRLAWKAAAIAAVIGGVWWL